MAVTREGRRALIVAACAALTLSAGDAFAMYQIYCDDGTSCAPDNCGTIQDSTGTCSVYCGGCPSGQACSYNYCCAPTSSCAAEGRSCGYAWNGCASVSCGTCPYGRDCNPSGQCDAPKPAEVLCGGYQVNTDYVPTIQEMTCGVGVWNGGLAVNFLNRWFAVVPQGLQGWQYQPLADGVTPLAIAPADSGDPYETDTLIEEDFDRKTEITRSHPPMQREWRTRQYSVDIGGRPYSVSAEQRVYDHRVDSGDVRMRGDVKIVITTPEPADGSTWTILLTPKRLLPGQDPAAVEPGATSAEEAGYSAIASPATLFPSRTVIYSPEVELASAARGGGSRTTQLAAAADPSMNNSADNMFSGVSQVLSAYEPEALNVSSSLLSAAGSDIVSFDQQRSAQFFMATRHASGFSNPGYDRPLVDTQTRQWTFRQPIINYTAYWPFLAGICGLSADVRSYLDGAFQVGATQCFDGIETSAYARGSISFVLDAGGGFGCNLLLASASAGLDAGVSEIFEFGSDLVTIPPKLSGYVRLYSSINFDAYFRVRVLFWTRRWSKHLGKTTVFQRQATWEVLPLGSEFNLCALDTDGGADDAQVGVFDNFEGSSPFQSCNGVVQCRRDGAGHVSHPQCDVLGYNDSCVVSYDDPSASAFLRYPIPSQSTGRVTMQNWDGACSGRYGAHRTYVDPQDGLTKTRPHDALDLWAEYGKPIYPARSGTVIYKQRNESPGKLGGLRAHVFSSFKDTNGTRHEMTSMYMHLSSTTIYINAGERVHRSEQKVDTNTVIGLAGQSGNACHNQHTHFQVVLDGAPFNPTTMFSQLPYASYPTHGGIVGVPGGSATPPPPPPPPPPPGGGGGGCCVLMQ